MLKKILLSLFGIITLGLINFSSAGNITYNGTFNYNKTSTSSVVRTDLFYINVPLDNIYNTSVSDYLSSVSCTFSNISFPSSLNYKNFIVYYYYGTNSSNTLINNVSTSLKYNGNGTYNFTLPSLYGNVLLLKFSVSFDNSDSSGTYSIDYSCTISGDGIIDNTCPTCPSCSQCESDLLTCQSDLLTCQNSSSSCSPNGQCSVSDKVSENIIFTGSKSFSSAGYTNMFNYGSEGAGTYCMKFTSLNPQTLTMGFANGLTTTPTNLYTLYNDQYGNTICLYGNKPYLNVKLNSSSNTIDYEVYKLTDLLSDSIPCSESSGESCDYSDYESQIQYLSGSLSLCESENSTLSGNLSSCEGELNSCMAGFGSGDLQRSALYINNIQHLGGSVIRITIPEEISWDYTSENDEFDLDIEGYNFDTEYISGIIDTQSTLPNQVDLNNLVKVILPLFVPGLVIILFIYFIFRFIKKIF